MTSGGSKKSEFESGELRQKAHQRLRRRWPNPSEMKKADLEAALSELEIHQVELELQHEELLETQARLAEARDRYLDLFEFAPVGYVVLDDGGSILQINMTAAELCGRERREIIGKRIEELVLSEDRDICYLYLRKVMTSGEKESQEMRFRGPEESIFWAHVETGILEMDEEGKRERYRMTLTDITSRREIEAELEQRLSELQSANDELVRFNRVAVDRELRIIELKKQVNELCAGMGLPQRYLHELEDEEKS